VLATVACSRGPGYYVDRGKSQAAVGKLQDAEILYRKALAQDPKFGGAYYQLGIIYVQLRNFREAYSSLRRAVELMPASEDAKVKLADVCVEEYLYNRRVALFYNQAVQISDQLLAKNANSFDGLRLKGTLALADKKFPDAATYLQKASQLKPGDPDVSLALTQALIFDNRSQAGEKLADELIHNKPAFGPIYDVLYRQYVRTNRPADAERILKAKVDNNPKQPGYILELANHYYNMQKAGEAISTLQRLLDNPKDFPNAHLLVGNFYSQKGKWDEAVAQFEAGARSNPGEAIQYQKRIVKAALAQGKQPEAIQAVQRILKDHPKDEEARGIRARLLLENGKPEDLNTALAEFQALLKDKPNDAELHYDLALAQLAKGDSDTARAELQEAIKMRNDYVSPRLILATMSLRQQRWEEALRYSGEVLMLDPSALQARLMHASALIGLRNYDAARGELVPLAKQFPQSQPVLMQLGLVAIGQKKYKEAEDVFGKLRRSGSDDLGPTQGLVEAYSAENRADEALKLLQDELRKSPSSVPLQMLLADAAASQGKLDLAVSQYQQLLSRNPKSAELRLRLGDVYRRKADWNNAIAMFQQAHQLAPNLAATELASSLESAGRSGEARALYEQLVRQRPNDPFLQNSLAFTIVETGGNLEEAQQLAQRALEKVPGQLHFADTLGSVYLKKKMTGSAVQIFRNLVRQDSKNPTFHYHLGMALLETGDQAGAKSELKEALAYQPSSIQKQRISELISKLN
jgi:tetratricopeptide (TPR) repeat protein